MIRVRNVYHMLAYAFQALRGRGYRDVATEEFDDVADLLAAILARGVESQVRRGLGREYVSRVESLSTPRGRIDVTASLKDGSYLRRRLVCDYDELSVDTNMNRVLKATMAMLLRSGVDRARRAELRRLLPFFSQVSDIGLADIDWHMRFDRDNQTYRMLMGVCWLACEGLLQTQSDGTRRLADFINEQRMCRLYEKFVLEYYRREHPGLHAGAPHIAWALDDGCDELLPVMRSDVTLSHGDRVLVIDAKYYSHVMQERFGRLSVHSGNLYQVFSYVKNLDAGLGAGTREVSGMLLYAATDEDVQPDVTYRMSGNRIDVRTLDLDQPFERIREQLDLVAEEHFGPGL